MDYVYTFDWYDGPRSGVADYNGQPHFFESQWVDVGSADRDWYMLSPIPEAVFEQEVEYWKLWKKYEAAYTAREIGSEHHPFLPVDRARGEELVQLLQNQLKIDIVNHLIAQAEFSPTDEHTRQANDAEMLVHWKILSSPPSDSRKADYNF